MLNTVELLEKILLELPCRQVFGSKKVARLWTDTIAGSLRLQIALCLKPLALHPAYRSRGEAPDQTAAPASTRRRIDAIDGSEDTLVWSLQFFNAHCHESGSADEFCGKVCTLALSRTAVVNPLLTDSFGFADHRRSTWEICENLPSVSEIARSLPKDMFLTQPPVSEVLVLMEVSCVCSTTTRYQAKSGVKRRLDDACVRAARRNWYAQHEEGKVWLRRQIALQNAKGVTAQDLFDCHGRVTGVRRVFEGFSAAEDAWNISIELVLSGERELRYAVRKLSKDEKSDEDKRNGGHEEDSSGSEEESDEEWDSDGEGE